MTGRRFPIGLAWAFVWLGLVSAAPTGAASFPGAPAPAPLPSFDAPLSGGHLVGDGSLQERIEATRFRALSLGSGSIDTAGRWLLSQKALGTAEERVRGAVRLAPDLPLVHAVAAWTFAEAGEPKRALASFGAALLAVPRHLEASLWLEGTLLAIATVALAVGSLFFLLVASMQRASDAAHDLGDALWPSMPAFSRAALLATIFFVPFVLGEGWALAACVLFAIAIAYGDSRMRVASVLAALLLLIAVHPLAERTGRALVALGSDPVARAVHAIAAGNESAEDRTLVANAAEADLLAARAGALGARRKGDLAEAARRYAFLLERRPHDPIALTNLGNLHYYENRTEEAIDFYERALATGPSAEILFNLSQAHARRFEVVAFDRALAQAQALDPAVIAELSRFGNQGFVIDLPIPKAEIRGRFLAAAEGDEFALAFRQRIAPGLLGRNLYASLLGFVGFGVLGALARVRLGPSSRCGRCGRRICVRCDESVWNGSVCDGCRQLAGRPEGVAVDQRRDRLFELEKRAGRLPRRLRFASGWIPGLAGLGVGRPDRALLACVCFAGAVASLYWVRGVVPDPMVMGPAGPAALGLLAVVAFAIGLGCERFGLRREPGETL